MAKKLAKPSAKLEPIRVYADTSVYGGVFDPEFAAASRAFFDQVDRGRFSLVISSVVRQEVAAAPVRVRNFFLRYEAKAQAALVDNEALLLQQAYLSAEINSAKWEADLLHVALATAAGCQLIVSLNFKHIVHFDKISRYNAVNVQQGHLALGIYSPLEVAYDEDETSIQ